MKNDNDIELDKTGAPVKPGYCIAHPDVREEYPCFKCLERMRKESRREHMKKVKEVLETFHEDLIKTTEAMYDSGEVDCLTYQPYQYALAKILITAAVDVNKNNYRLRYRKEDRDAISTLAKWWRRLNGNR